MSFTFVFRAILITASIGGGALFYGINSGYDFATLIEGEPVYTEDMNGWERKRTLETPLRLKQVALKSNALDNWPPTVGQPFPAVEMYDHNGAPFSISDLSGKPVVIEFSAMSCAGCQALSGGGRYGGYGKFAVQNGLQSLDEYFHRVTGHDLNSNEVHYVNVIVYDLKLQPPSVEELANWRKHFHLTGRNTYVVSGGAALANGVTFKMIPGVVLLDKHLNVVSDSTGHHPQHDLYQHLLPHAERLLSTK